MTVTVIHPVDLPDPPGDPGSLRDLVTEVARSAFSVGVVQAQLADPAARAAQWQGSDAQAATGQVGSAADVARDVHDVLVTAGERLGRHAELLEENLGLTAILRRTQAVQLDAVAARLTSLDQGPYLTYEDRTQATALMAALREQVATAEASRVAVHAGWVQEVLDDATATAAALGAAVARVGGGGAGPGTADQVTLCLAVRWPEWGAGELTARAVQAADELGAPGTSDEMAATAARYAAFAGNADFASTLVRILGADGVQYSLQTLYLSAPDAQAQLVSLLGPALSTASSAGRTDDVLADLVDPDGDGATDTVVLGLAVLASASPLAPSLASTLARQVIAREVTQGVRTVDAVPSGAAYDALPVLLQQVAQDPVTAAGLLDTADVWTPLLARDWAGSDALVTLVAAVATLPPELTRLPTEAALVGAGQLLEQMYGDDDVAARGMASLRGVSDSVTSMVQQHWDLLVTPIVTSLGAPGVRATDLPPETVLALTGLGLLSLDPDTRLQLGAGLTAWTAGSAVVVDPVDEQSAAYVQGVFTAALTAGEVAGRNLGVLDVLSDSQDAQAVVTAVVVAVGFWPKVGSVLGAVGSYLPIVDGPGVLVVPELAYQPDTGAYDAEAAAVRLVLPGLVAAGALPDPGANPSVVFGDQGRIYESTLDPAQRLLWERVRDGAASGFQDAGVLLGIVPGSEDGAGVLPGE